MKKVKPDTSKERAALLHHVLRTFIVRAMGLESPSTIFAALTYEIVSIAASISTTKEEALALLLQIQETADKQIQSFGVGRVHP